MRAVQIIEMGDQGRDARCHVEGLQHVGAHEIGQIAYRFHRHGLVEQL